MISKLKQHIMQYISRDQHSTRWDRMNYNNDLIESIRTTYLNLDHQPEPKIGVRISHTVYPDGTVKQQQTLDIYHQLSEIH